MSNRSIARLFLFQTLVVGWSLCFSRAVRLVAIMCAVLGMAAIARAQSPVSAGFNPGANSGVYAIVVQPDGKILLGSGQATVGENSHYGAVEGRAFVLHTGGAREPLIRLLQTSRPVFKVFGVSGDNRRLLYSPLKDGAPSGELYVEDLVSHVAQKITDRVVISAAWSPIAESEVAVAYTAGDHFGVEVTNLDTQETLAAAEDRVIAEWIEWDASGERLYYLRADETYVPGQMGELIFADVGSLELPTKALRGLVLVGRGRPGSSLMLSDLDVVLSNSSRLPLALASGADAVVKTRFRLLSPGGQMEVRGTSLLGSGALFARRTPEDGVPQPQPQYLCDGVLVNVLVDGIVVRLPSPQGSSRLAFIDWAGRRYDLSAAIDMAGRDPDTQVGVAEFNLPITRLSDVQAAVAGFHLPLARLRVTQGGEAYPAPGNCGLYCAGGVPCGSHWNSTTSKYAYDMSNSLGAHVMAAATGLVVLKEGSLTPGGSGWGNYVVLQHADGSWTRYAHLQEYSLRVELGGTACAGLWLGNQGNTGNSTAAHLHFQKQFSASGQSEWVDFAGVTNPLSCSASPTLPYTSSLSEVSTCTTSTLPDLVVTAVTAPSTGTIGGQITISATVANQGTASAGAYRLGFYFSMDATITTSDTLSAACTMSALESGTSATCSGPITIPSLLSPGTYYFGAFADDLGAVSESNDGNNTATQQITISASTYTIAVSASPTAGGTVSGSGTFGAGSSRTVTATANGGYTFANWTENGSVMSSSTSYTFTLNASRVLVANFTTGSFDPDIAALANTTQAVRWFYINPSGWYIVDAGLSSNAAVLQLNSVDPTFSGGIRWKPISNYPAYAGFPAAGINLSSVAALPNGQSITFGGLTTSQTDPDITALANTTQPVRWFYINPAKWYIVGVSSGSNPAVLLLNSVDSTFSGGIRWRPISNYAAYAGFPAAGINFSSVTVSADGRSITFGGLR